MVSAATPCAPPDRITSNMEGKARIDITVERLKAAAKRISPSKRDASYAAMSTSSQTAFQTIMLSADRPNGSIPRAFRSFGRCKSRIGIRAPPTPAHDPKIAPLQTRGLSSLAPVDMLNRSAIRRRCRLKRSVFVRIPTVSGDNIPFDMARRGRRAPQTGDRAPVSRRRERAGLPLAGFPFRAAKHGKRART